MSTPKNKPTYEELETMLAKLAAQILVDKLDNLTARSSRQTMPRNMAKLIGQLIGQDSNAPDTMDDEGQPVCYEKASPSGEVVTVDIAPTLAMPIEIIGTHESKTSLQPIQKHVDQGGGLVWELAGQQIERGYYELTEDGRIFACIEGLHIRLNITAIFQAILTPDIRGILASARDQFNGLNNATGLSHHYDSNHEPD